jgi:two-component system sensor histidine kinase RpfC
VLERAGHAVTVVENGADAVEALRRNSFDVALMDLNMPVLNGIDAFKQYRSSLGDRAPTPVVALTADATTEAADRCAEVGFQACATKPIKPEDLLELISKVVARSLIESESPTLIPEPAHANGNHCGPTGKDTVRRETLRKLEQLGGRHFVEELIEQYTNDGQHMLDCLQLALAETNAVEFGDQLHAMRSAAGNIGAESLYCICLSLRRITREDLAAKGEEHLQRLTAEFERVRQELADYLAGAAAAQDLVSGLA